VNNDSAVNIVTSLPTPNVAIPAIEEKVKPVLTAQAPEKDKEPPQSKDVVATPSPQAKSTSPNKANSIGLAAGEEIVVIPSTSIKAKTEDLANKTGSGKFVIQIGSFASEERANGWIAKMKDQKIPNYVLNKTGADGVKLYVLRAGPFSDKDAAEAAEKKVKAMGLSPRLVEVGSP
jgi:DedD protein